MIEALQTTGEHTRICPKCNNIHLTDNNYCEFCLYEFIHEDFDKKDDKFCF
jgi:recombinational DNA repair protein RecR